ncbi:MAG: DNA repair protein RecN [Woeseiaceae bacterium]|nr:DNA repair protein RecN [Woeseiaceae bacterium]
MLLSLSIRDFAIVDAIDVEFGRGMTVLTGETGAGKSILVDAIGFVLGERGSSQIVRDGAERAEFGAEFGLDDEPGALEWLREQALDEEGACLLRRIVGADGRSRAFINGQAVTLGQLKALGEQLLDIHGQHFHQSLGRRDIQRDLLDYFGDLLEVRRETAVAYREWRSLADELAGLREAERDRADRLDLLNFQLSELEALGLADGEIEELTAERLKLRHSGRLAEGVGGAIEMLTGAETGNATSLVAAAQRAMEPLVEYDAELAEVLALLESAGIQIAEAGAALERYADGIEMDPRRRDWLEERLDSIHAVARRHRVEPAELPAVKAGLRREREALETAAERGAGLEQAAAAAKAGYERLAEALSRGRTAAAERFAASVTEAMEGLGMPGGRFAVAVEPLADGDARPWGRDHVEFRITANPGQPLGPLSKVASGGELSRMSLAIQVIASRGSAIQTMVFDEVDSGVGGRVAEMVGRRLRELGADRQVLCVTHLPQVASLADAHFRVSKVSDGRATRTGIQLLEKEERVEEIARMLGGVKITTKTLEHAREMLAGALQRKRA